MQNQLLVWSNVGWVVPGVMAYLSHDLWLVVAAILMVILSSLYHLTQSWWWEMLDTGYALLYMSLGPFLLWQVNATVWEWTGCITVAVSAVSVWVIARMYYTTQGNFNYDYWHSLWHGLSAMSATLVYIVYFGYAESIY